MRLSVSAMVALMFMGGVTFGQNSAQSGKADDAEKAQIRSSEEQFVKVFNAAQADELAAMFLPKGELIDEHGQIYQGQQEIKGLHAKYFARFPGAKLTLVIDSVRLVGPVAIEEGTRLLTTKDAASQARLRYIAIRTKVGDGWQIASLREFADHPPAAPHDHLQTLTWLVGDWVNEGSDGIVKISYRWSEDKNFLLGDFVVTRTGQSVMKSTQRIGWDPLTQKIRSWLFDSDGGFGEGHWTAVEGAWIIKSSAVMPDGQTGSATLKLTPKGKDRYTMQGTDRIIGDGWDADFEVTVTRTSPTPATRK